MSDPQFPEEILTFTLDGVNEGPVSAIASYSDYTDYVDMGATVTSGFTSYRVVVDSLQDVSYQGRAVCGIPKEFLTHTLCVMVGSNEVLDVSTASDIPMEQVVAFIETIYDIL